MIVCMHACWCVCACMHIHMHVSVCLFICCVGRMRDLRIPKSSGPVSFGQLLGMGDHLTYPVGASGYQAYKLIPYGPVGEVVPYLLRRAQENSSGMVNAERERRLLNREVWLRLMQCSRAVRA